MQGINKDKERVSLYIKGLLEMPLFIVIKVTLITSNPQEIAFLDALKY